MRTSGISPKVLAVVAALGGPGVLILLLGVLLKDDTLRTVGLSLLGGGAVGSGAGYAAKPGQVVDEHDVDEPEIPDEFEPAPAAPDASSEAAEPVVPPGLQEPPA